MHSTSTFYKRNADATIREYAQATGRGQHELAANIRKANPDLRPEFALIVVNEAIA